MDQERIASARSSAFSVILIIGLIAGTLASPLPRFPTASPHLC